MIGSIAPEDFSTSLCCAQNNRGVGLRGKIRNLRNGDSSQGMINRRWSKRNSVINLTVFY